MSLNRNQRLIYIYRVSLYRPAVRAALPNDFEAQDEAYEPHSAYQNVLCYYQATPEFTNVNPIGLTKEENIFTSDKWYFDAAQDINDSWLIVLTACATKTSLVGRCWVVQGNSEINDGAASRPVNNLWVYAKLSPTNIIPAGS